MNSIYVILNKETNEMLVTHKGKWHWSSRNAAGSAYTLSMREDDYGGLNPSIPRLRDVDCPYFAKEIPLGYDKEDRSKTLAIRKEIQS